MTERTLGREQAIYRVTWIGFAVNLVLSAGKLAAGIWGHSAAMVADAIHSVSDFATDLVVLLFVRVSAKPTTTTATGNTKRWLRSSSA